jgi:hypothetical protein
MSNFVPSVYAQFMAIQPTPDGVLLSFFEAVPPIIQDTTPEVLEELKRQGVKAECVARITVSKNRFLEFAKVVKDVSAKMSLDKK